MKLLSDRLAEVERRILAAAQRAGRARDSITLVAVTKTFPAQATVDAYNLGLRVFGENYVQEFEEKFPQLQSLPDAQFHLIGHLQSNKAARAAELFRCIETVDSPKLATRLDTSGKALEVMIEVKLSEEASKHGCDPAGLPALIGAIRACPNLTLTGLMTMPPWSDNPEETRPYFRRLASLAREHTLPKLSMGMSHDFEAAIEEGATHIRVGTALFGPRTIKK